MAHIELLGLTPSARRSAARAADPGNRFVGSDRIRSRFLLPPLHQQMTGSRFAVTNTGQEPVEITAGPRLVVVRESRKARQGWDYQSSSVPPRNSAGVVDQETPGSRAPPTPDRRAVRYGHWRYVGQFCVSMNCAAPTAAKATCRASSRALAGINDRATSSLATVSTRRSVRE